MNIKSKQLEGRCIAISPGKEMIIGRIRQGKFHGTYLTINYKGVKRVGKYSLVGQGNRKETVTDKHGKAWTVTFVNGKKTLKVPKLTTSKPTENNISHSYSEGHGYQFSGAV
jgi:hypothetical protein